MGTTSDKLTYLATTKTKIKDAINLGNTNITNETFRQYENKIKQAMINTMNDKWGVWNNFDKVIGTSETLTLNNTEYAPMQVNLKGNTSQDSTTGKNKLALPTRFNISSSNVLTPTWNNDGSITFTGTMTGGGLNYNGSLPSNLVLPAGTYTLSANGSSNVSGSLNARDNSGNVISCDFTGNRSITLTEQKTITQLMFYFNPYTGNIDITFKPQLESGSATSWEPYTGGSPAPSPSYPFDIHNVSGDNTIEICGKNLLPFENINVTKNGLNIYSLNGNLYINGTNSSPIYSTEKLFEFTLNAGTYTSSPIVSGTPNYFLRKKSDNTTINESNRTFTLNETTDVYLCAFIGANTYNNYQVSWQLEKGSTSSEYEAYTGNSQLISLGNIELNKIDTYQDYIYKEEDRWYLHKEIGKVVLDGSEAGWTKSGSYSNSYFINASDSYSINISDTNIYVCCNYYKSTYYSNVVNYDYTCILSNNKNIMIHNKDIDNLPDFKTWLSTHNTIVYYVLGEPTDTEITDSTLISQLNNLANVNSYEGQTNISQENNDKPFIITATALEDIS